MIAIRRPAPTRITLRGHAGSGEFGRDLVCAAVSALALTLAENLKYQCRPGICLRPGDADLSCVCTPEAERLFDSFWHGFRLLAQMYPESVQLDSAVYDALSAGAGFQPTRNGTLRDGGLREG